MSHFARRVSITSLGLGTGLLLLAGCGSSPERASIGGSVSSPMTLPAPKSVYDNPAGTVDIELSSINRLVNTSDAAVIATVEAVSAPRWNSASGNVWVSDPNDPNPQKAQPFQYRDVTLQVRRVLFGSTSLAPVAESTIDVKVYGSGQNTGAMVNGDPNDRWNQMSGPFTPGDTQLVFLISVDFPMQSGPTPAVVLNQDAYGHWVIDGPTAQSAIAGRSVSVQDLQSRIATERAAGLRQETPDQASKSQINPLG